MNERDMKDRIYEQFARMGMAIASPGRIELLELLAQGEKTVERLASESGHEVRNTSAHLKVLRHARLVETRKEGRHVHYRLADHQVFHALREIQALARARLIEIDHIAQMYFEERDGMEPVGAEELLRRMREGAVTVLDVRPEDEFRTAHITGAISVPLREIERRIADVPRDREVVAYCRGPYCVYAVQAVQALREAGFQARRMEDGLPDWRARGFPVEIGEYA